MAKVKFTAQRVERFICPPDKAQAFLWDETQPGLALRTTPNGAAAFVHQSTYRGKTVRITIGRPTTWTIPMAQAKARQLQYEIDEGRDPRGVKRGEIAADKAKVEAAQEATARAVTVGDLWPVYLEEGRPKRKLAWKPGYRADLEAMAGAGGVKKIRGKGKTRRGVLYPLLSLALVDVNEDSLKDWFDRETKKGSIHQAARGLMMFRGFLRWCAGKPDYKLLVDRQSGAAPAILDSLPPAKLRRDMLEADQVAPWWDAVTALPNQIASAYLRCLLLTGARREEMAALKWKDIDFQWGKLTIADKVDATREIPLSGYVASILAALPRSSEFVFASAGKSGHISDVRASHGKALAQASIKGLTLHGLRRTFSTLSEAAGCPAGAIAQVMGHKPSGTAEGYRPRSPDALRPYLSQAETYILTLAGIDFKPQAKPRKALRVVA